MMNPKSLLLALGLGALTVASAFAQGTAFTYQGRLNNGTNLASGTYDLQFTLFTTNVMGTAVAGPLTAASTAVNNGLFTVTIDFGSAFTGATNWLELAVRTNGSTTFSNLVPRQRLTPVPYAIYAETANATNLVGTVPSGNLGGVALLAGGNAFTGQQSVMTGNVGVGTTTPAKPLDVAVSAGPVTSGTTSVDPSLSLFIRNTTANGTLASPNEAGIGFGQASTRQAIMGGTFGDDLMDFFIGGNLTTPKMRISHSGFVGIGTGITNPATALQVSGTVTAAAFVGNGSGLTGITVSGAALLASPNTFSQDQTVLGQVVAGGASGAITLLDRFHPVNGFGWQWVSDSTGLNATRFNGGGGSEFFLISTNGNVGINTTVNSARLAIGQPFNGSQSQLDLLKPGSNLGYQVETDANGLGICEQNVACGRFYIQNGTGNIGIGTTTPTENLTIAGVTNYNSGLKLTGSSVNGTGMALENTSSGGHKYVFVSAGSADQIAAGCFGLGDDTALAYRFVVNANGNFGIGTTTPNTERLVVAGGGDFTAPAANAGNDSGVGISFESYGGRIDSFQLKPLILNPSGNRVGVFTTTPQYQLDVNGEIGCTAINLTSDRNAKQDFQAIDPRTVLAKVAALPITEWQYKAEKDKDAAANRHIGPMAQDFTAAFALSQDDKHISVVDEGGVALAAIQGLNQKLEEKNQEVEALKQNVAELRALVNQLVHQQSGTAK